MIRLLFCIILMVSIAKADEDFFADDDTSDSSTVEQEIFYDPLEKINRVSFKILMFGNEYVMLPLASAYDVTVPRFLHSHIRSFTQNTREPINVMNSLFIPHKPNAMHSLSRFVFNTTFGLFGFFDVHSQYAEPQVNIGLDDIAQYYSNKPLPYLIIPPISAGNIFVPADLLALTLLSGGLESDYTNTLFALSFTRTLLIVHANRTEIEDAINTIDSYSILRTVYYQLQQGKIQKLSKTPMHTNYAALLPDSFH